LQEILIGSHSPPSDRSFDPSILCILNSKIKDQI